MSGGKGRKSRRLDGSNLPPLGAVAALSGSCGLAAQPGGRSGGAARFATWLAAIARWSLVWGQQQAVGGWVGGRGVERAKAVAWKHLSVAGP